MSELSRTYASERATLLGYIRDARHYLGTDAQGMRAFAEAQLEHYRADLAFARHVLRNVGTLTIHDTRGNTGNSDPAPYHWSVTEADGSVRAYGTDFHATVSEAAQDAQRVLQELIDNERRKSSLYRREFPDMPAQDVPSCLLACGWATQAGTMMQCRFSCTRRAELAFGSISAIPL